MSFLYFIILVGVLIFVHELGHFLVAKAFDVKVLRFSIGFGPKIAGYQRGETEYVLCALPLGGYVQMLGSELDDLDSIPAEDRDRALMAKAIWKRSLIILAGPVSNLLLPIVIYFLVTMATTTASPALVGEVFEDTPAAAAGLQPGDRIVEIEGEEIGYWHDLTAEISDSWDQQLTLKYRRDGELHTTEISPEKKVSTDFLGLNVQTYGMIGIHLGTYGTTLALADRDGPAARAGLESFDGIVTIDGEPIERFDQIASKVRNSDGAPLEIVAMRRIPLDIDYGKAYRQRVVRATVEPERVDGQWTIGVVRAEMVLTEVEEDSPARAAGLQVGDRIVALDERSFNNWSMVNRTIHNTINEKILEQHEKGVEDIDVDPSFEVTYVRQGERHTTTLEPRVVKYKDESKQQQYRFEIGWNHFRDTEYPDEIDFPFFERVQYAATNSVDRTGSFVKMIVMGFVRMAQGRISLGNVGGPILIGELAAKAGEAGWEPFLQMMALISINLGVFNLLPIPLLDGGHLLLYLLEAIKRGPLSFRARQIASYIGMVLVLMLFVLAFKNDIERKWDDIVEYVNE